MQFNRDVFKKHDMLVFILDLALLSIRDSRIISVIIIIAHVLPTRTGVFRDYLWVVSAQRFSLFLVWSVGDVLLRFI